MNLLEIALCEWGTEEIPGANIHNERILHYAKTCGQNWVCDDETSWCGIFIGFCATNAGLNPPAGPASARNWLNFGKPTEKPKCGDVVVFWRDDPNSAKGHVALFIRYDEKTRQVHALGGNQGNKVCIMSYPVDRVLGYRAV